MSFSNAQLAQKISDLIDYWSSFSVEYADWLGGTVSGGPNSDGEYPLTDYTGTETLVKSPAKLQDDVDNITTGATAQANAAAASAAAALTSENNAATSAATALSHANDADADRIAAAASETNATNAAVTSTAQANLATDRAGYAQEWANAPFQTLVSSAAGGDQIDDYSALHWATVAEAFAGSIDSNLYGQLAQAETVSGLWSFSAGLTMTAGHMLLPQENDAATPTLAFGNGASGIYSATVNNLSFVTQGLRKFQLTTVAFQSDSSTGAYLTQTGSSATTPSLCPRVNDIDTGVGSGTADTLSLIAGGVEGIRLTEAAAAITVDLTGSLAVTGTVTGSNLNVANWDTAYGWGDHAGLYSLVSHNHAGVYEPADATILKDADIGVTVAAFAHNHSGVYEPVDASLVRSGTLTQEDNYTYLNRNNATNPVLHVAQVGAGPIARFGKVPTLGSTGYTAEITFGNDGSITAEGLTSNDVTQTARLNIVGGTSGNTHYNWNSVGENYITHKNTGFTRFRSYDGVSTYTTHLELDSGGLTMYGVDGTTYNLELQGTAPTIYLKDTDASADDFWIHVNSNNFYILRDNADDGSWDSPHPLQLEADTNLGYMFGNPIVSAGSSLTNSYIPLTSQEMSSSINLNNLQASSAGFYHQTSNADTTGNNYPNGLAGSLLVQKNAGQCTQLYITYDSSPQMFVRTYYTGWGSWYELAMKNATATISATYTYSVNPKRNAQGGFIHHNSSSYTDGGVTFSTSARSGGTSGDIWFQYT